MISRSSFFEDNVKELTESFPLTHLKTIASIRYGTAGFRCVHQWLPPISARVILVALIRSISLCKQHNAKKVEGSACNKELISIKEITMGVMITASHNPCGDNGMKIIDVGGEMLDSSWEQWCTHAANANDAARLTQILCECCEAFCISRDDVEKYVHHVTFFMGRDTRPSGKAIIRAMKWVLTDLFHVHCIDFGVVTTPQLHFYVNKAHDMCVQCKRASVHANNIENNDKSADASTMEIQETALELYNNTIGMAFTKLLSFANTALCKEACVATDTVNVVQEENEAVKDKLVEYNKSREYTHVTNRVSDHDIANVSKDIVVSGAEAASASTRNKTTNSNLIHLIVDASNGVGSIALRHLFTQDESYRTTTNAIIMINKEKEYFCLHMVNCHTESPNMLNDLCGADYAKFTGKPSHEMLNYPCDTTTDSLAEECKDETEVNDANRLHHTHFYCLDGDADRLIGFCRTECHQKVQIDSHDETVRAAKDRINSSNTDNDNGDTSGDVKMSKCTWRIIDGDRIAILYATLLRAWLGPELLHELQIAIVQTAYANGATRKYIEDILHLRSIITATGVKHLHKAAKEVGIGIYFEANGHGTILINRERCNDVIRHATYLTEDEKDKKVEMLTALSQLASQVCGDAIADMLLCELAFKALQLTPNDIIGWYDEFPAVQIKVRVPDPSVITTTADEQHALTPVGLQSAIDDAVRSIQEQFCDCTNTDEYNNTKSSDIDNDKMPNKITNITVGTIHARAFVRPSGTEPIVRVYCEASRQDACEQLSKLIVEIVSKYCM